MPGTVQWFPGHMAKTRRLIAENLKQVDIVFELLDARIPESSQNPEIARLTEGKPILTLLNKASLSDPAANAAWLEHFKKEQGHALLIDCVTGEGVRAIAPAAREILKDKLARYEAKGMAGRRIRAMIVGIPNVGKSSLLNRLSGKKRARVEDRPGVTLGKQWVTTPDGLDLLDTPGVLWPKFDDPVTGENLAVTGAVRDQVLDVEAIAVILCGRLRRLYPAALAGRYKLPPMEELEALDDYDLFELIGKKRGFLLSGGAIDCRRTAEMLLDEFRGAKIGRMTLERPKTQKQDV